MSNEKHTSHAAQPPPKRKRKLTVNQLLAKFPEMHNEFRNGCLEDMACPECGQRDSFRIRVSTVVEINDDGTDDHEDTEWDNNSFCACPNDHCPAEGKVRDFTFKWLDETILQRTP